MIVNKDMLINMFGTAEALNLSHLRLPIAIFIPTKIKRKKQVWNQFWSDAAPFRSLSLISQTKGRVLNATPSPSILSFQSTNLKHFYLVMAIRQKSARLLHTCQIPSPPQYDWQFRLASFLVTK